MGSWAQWVGDALGLLTLPSPLFHSDYLMMLMPPSQEEEK